MTITDEVWRQLDPGAGKLSRRTAVRLGVAAAVAVLLLVAGVAVWRTGLVVPRLAWPDGPHEWTVMDPDGVVRIDFLVENDGEFPVTVRDVGRSAPGFELLRVEGGTVDDPNPAPVFPVTLDPHTGVGAVLVYRITDCSAVPAGEWPVTARVERPWGVMTVDVRETSPWAVPWQQHLADTVCRPG